MLTSPTTDFIEITNVLGQAWGVGVGEPLIQYLRWSEQAGILSALTKRRSLEWSELLHCTELSISGVNALVPVLLALNVVKQLPSRRLQLTDLAKEYLLIDSEFYVGDGLYSAEAKPLPASYVSVPSVGVEVKGPWDIGYRLKVQHSRNFAPSVLAARSGQFTGIRHLIDVAGGSGVLSIPLALDQPDLQITLIDLPEVLPHTRSFLSQHGVQDRVQLVGMDALREPWSFPDCDGVYFGNLFHSQNDSTCQFLCKKSFDLLPIGGKILIHEVLFNEMKDGPLLAALWNAVMLYQNDRGRQRTALEFVGVLQSVGFEDWSITPTSNCYSLVSAIKLRERK